MKKIKYTILLFILLVIILIIPNISNAATEYTYSDKEQGIEWSYELDNSGNVINLKLKTTNKIGAITIPSKIDGKNVISLKTGSYHDGDGAFEDCKGITGITIPNTIDTIPYQAFYNCIGLRTVTIPNSVTSIGNLAFANCTGITSIVLPQKLSSIEGNAFYGCSGLVELTIPSSVVLIGDSAFYGCSGLKNLKIPNSVTTIGEYAFSGCSGLKEVKLSESLTKISNRSFKDCSGITSIIIPSSVTTIEERAFYNCSSLSKILIPDSVASIDDYDVFWKCKDLTIYGNDGKKSKEYAEANKIKFDYIANWDKKDSGADITPPTVKSIKVQNTSVMNYKQDVNLKRYMVPAGAKLRINVNLSENIKGTTVPTLTIKFGDGKNIKVTEGTITGSTISYVYTLQKSDKGVMATVNLSGGDIKDLAGNTATLSCPPLSIEYHSGYFVYANGTSANTDGGNTDNGSSNNGNSNNNNGNGSSNNNSSTNNNGNSNNSGTNGKKDDTVATGKLPQTGVGIGLASIIILFIGGVVFAYLKYNKLKDIK